jgi:hypothetical protein
VYVFLAVRRVYALSPAAALATTAAPAAAFVGLLVAYRGRLFFTTYYTLGTPRGGRGPRRRARHHALAPRARASSGAARRA